MPTQPQPQPITPEELDWLKAVRYSGKHIPIRSKQQTDEQNLPTPLPALSDRILASQADINNFFEVPLDAPETVRADNSAGSPTNVNPLQGEYNKSEKKLSLSTDAIVRLVNGDNRNLTDVYPQLKRHELRNPNLSSDPTVSANGVMFHELAHRYLSEMPVSPWTKSKIITLPSTFKAPYWDSHANDFKDNTPEGEDELSIYKKMRTENRLAPALAHFLEAKRQGIEP